MKVLYLGRTQCNRHRVGTNQSEGSFADKDLGILMANKLNTSQKHALEGQHHPGLCNEECCQKLLTKVTLPLYWFW